MFNAASPLSLSQVESSNVPMLSFGEFRAILERVEAIERAISLYGSFPTVSGGNPVQSRPPLGDGSSMVVLVTGTTGNLGSRILLGLLKDERVKTIYAVNRPSAKGTLERHLERFEDSGLDKQPLSSPKVIFIEADLSSERLGLDEHMYEKLRTSIDIIIHSAWRLGFVAPLSAFEPNIRATRNLIDLGRASPRFQGLAEKRVKFIFTSSVSATYGWPRTLGPYPEEIVFNAKYAIGTGYGESKYVVERILDRSGLNATSLRIGQCCGGLPNGAWPVVEWYPALVKSSIAMDILPLMDATLRLIPIDVVSGTILDLVFCPKVFPPAMNVVHPIPIACNHLVMLISEALVAQRITRSPLASVPLSEWVAKLELLAKKSKADLERLPALKLIGLYKNVVNYDIYSGPLSPPASNAGYHVAGLPDFKTSKIRQLSPTIRDIKPIEKRDVERWVRYWLDVGFFDDLKGVVDLHQHARL